MFLMQLGFRILSDINGASVAMPSALVATALLTLRTDRVRLFSPDYLTELDLASIRFRKVARRADYVVCDACWFASLGSLEEGAGEKGRVAHQGHRQTRRTSRRLCRRLHIRHGRPVRAPSHLNDDVQALIILLNLLLRAGRTIGSLSDLVGKRKTTEVVEPTIYAKKPIELSLYRNQIIHVFLSECTSPLSRVCSLDWKRVLTLESPARFKGILCASLYLKVKTGPGEEFMSVEDLVTECRYLSNLLRIEVRPLSSFSHRTRHSLSRSSPFFFLFVPRLAKFVFPLAGIDENVREALRALMVRLLSALPAEKSSLTNTDSFSIRTVFRSGMTFWSLRNSRTGAG